MTTRREPLSARLRLVLLTVLTALAALLLPAPHASASGLPAAQTRVGAIGPAVTISVGVHECITAGQRPVRGSSQLRLVSGHCVAAEAVPARVARVMDTDVASVTKTLGGPKAPDVFVTPAGQLDGLTSREIAEKLTLQNGDGSLRTGPFSVFEFDTPEGIASPVFRDNPGFVPGGATAGGAPEWVVPNLRLEDLVNLTRSDAP